jgi:arsenate reductase
MAEALMKGLDSTHFEVLSAGVERVDIHPLTIEVMKEIDIDLEGKVTKEVSDLTNLGFDFVITLCDRAKSKCPNFPGAEIIHWQLDNPFAASDHTKQKRMFQSLRDQIAQRIRLFALVQVRFAKVDTNPHHDLRCQQAS